MMINRLASLGALLSLLLLGCASIPEGRSAVDAVDVEGNEEVGEGDITDAIATQPNQRFLWLFEGIVYDYSIFNRFVLARDLARVERLYRAQGFYQARVTAGRIHPVGEDEVRVEIVVEEGPRTTVESLRLEGPLDDALREDLRYVVAERISDGAPFVEEDFTALEEDLERTLKNRGHAWAEVERDAFVDIVEHRADLVYRLEPGPTATFGEVTIEGLGQLPDEEVRATLGIRPGQPFSAAVLDRAHRHALELGVFASVRVEPQLGDGPREGAVVPVRVRVQPGDLHTIRAGGGVALDTLRSEAHLRAGWEDRNFLGGLRRFSVEIRPGVVFYPLRVNNWVAPQQPLPEGSFDIRLEQPDFIEDETTGYVAPSVRVDPVLLRTNPSPDDPVLGYVDAGVTVGAERHFWDDQVRLTLEKTLLYALPFAYVGERDPLLRDVLLGFPSFMAELDLRDDPLEPTRGVVVRQTIEAALYADGRDLKLIPEVQTYAPLGPLVFAVRGRLGFLFPFNYGDTIQGQLDAPVGGRNRDEVRDLQLMYFRGFFGGGASSNRGYPPRTLGPHAVVPFLNPETESASLAQRCQADTVGRCATPIGGKTLWELSLELRFPIVDPLSGATFCDMGDVAPGEVQLRPSRLHLSCGVGLRYGTPVGPIRLDVAYRVPRAQVLGGDENAREEGDPGTIFGAPINLAVGIGEAF